MWPQQNRRFYGVRFTCSSRSLLRIKAPARVSQGPGWGSQQSFWMLAPKFCLKIKLSTLMVFLINTSRLLKVTETRLPNRAGLPLCSIFRLPETQWFPGGFFLSLFQPHRFDGFLMVVGFDADQIKSGGNAFAIGVQSIPFDFMLTC